MRKIHGWAMGVTLLMGGYLCVAQQSPIPFQQLQQAKEIPAREMASVNGAANNLPPAARSAMAASVSSSSSARAAFYRAPAATGAHKLGISYFLLNGLHLGMAGADVALTQHCIAEHRCREGNPVMPSSLAGSLGVDSALVGLGAFISGRLKTQGSAAWWVTPVTGIAAHGAGVATGLAHQ